jgi:hypothetical protein
MRASKDKSHESKSRGKRRPDPDWIEIRRQRETEGKSFSALSRAHGVHRGTIAARSKRENWRDPADFQQERSSRTAEEIMRGFVTRDAKSVLKDLTRKHELNGQILGLVERYLAALKAYMDSDDESLLPDSVSRVLGGRVDPVLALRRVALVVQTVECVDSNLAFIKTDDSWRSGLDSNAEESGESSRRIRDALARLARGNDERSIQ